MMRMYDMRQKEVINTRDGCRFGFISDIEINEDDGTVATLIISGPGRVFGIFGRDQEYHIPWKSVNQVGDDIILVDVDTHKIIVDCE